MVLKRRNKYSLVLMAAIFATGFSGIVAEYLLSTLATYFLGDSIFQWTMIVSTMMFTMGVGSRISKYFTTNLLVKFLTLEFILSLTVAFAPIIVYTLSAYTDALGVFIYGFSMLIGTLIGMEIPLVTRINGEYEALKTNISNVLEKDYYGSLLGGVFFAFIGIPLLGLSYTPFLLGFVNFAVAILVFFYLNTLIAPQPKRLFNITGLGIFILLMAGVYFANPIIKYGEQKKYLDKVVYAKQTKYQRIVMTQWKDEYWLYLNGNLQLSTIDEVMYHEPLVHPAMQLHPHPQNILVLGGGDGCAVREILKYNSVENVTLVDLDPAMTKLGLDHPVWTAQNGNALKDPKVEVINKDGFLFLANQKQFYDVIIVDLPDPKTVELNRLYSQKFYRIAYKHLRPNGVLITQAGSPYFATRAFNCIFETMTSADFKTVALHNQILSLGEWGWVLGVKTNQDFDVKDKMQRLDFKDVDTEWINQEAMQLITSFGKNIFPIEADSVDINRIHDPVLYKYYLDGNWDLY